MKGAKKMNAKRLLALLLAMVMVLGLAACGTPAPAETTAPAGTTKPAETTAPPTDPALTYIPAPYTVDAEIAGPKEYLEPKFYANGEGEPTIGVTYVGVIVEDGKYFKDSDNDKELDIFEDWRLDDETRAKDLLTKLTVAQKIGMQQVQMVLTPTATTYADALDANGKVDLSKLMVISDKVTGVEETDPSRVNNSTAEIISFGNRMGVIRTITDIKTGALYNNATNMTAEYAAVAKNEANIPFTIIANPQYVMGEPITVGIAAAVMGDVAAGGDYNAIERYADLDRQIWRAKGIDRMYGQQIDLITDPRWTRNLTTFTEDPTVLSNIATALVKGYQGSTEGLQDDGIAMIMKHFPGDSASYNGLESHAAAGQLRMYMVEGSLEKYFLPAFQAAVDAKVAGIMPCYSRPALINAKQTYRGVDINPASLGSAYNETILQTLLRDTMGFEGFINTDSNVLIYIPWGAEDMTLVERAATMINAGSDVHGEWWGEPIQYSIFQQAYDEGKLTQEALDRSTLNNLKPMFATGEYENPYRDPDQSQKAMDDLSSKTAAMGNELSSKSLVLLKNHENTLPLKETGKKVFVATFSKAGADDAKKASWEATFTKAGYTIVTSAEEAEILMLDVSPALNETTKGFNTLEIGEDIEVIEVDSNTGAKTGDTIEFTTVVDADKIKEYADIVHNNGGIVLGTVAVGSPWILTNLEPYCDALIANFAPRSTAAQDSMAMGNPIAPTDLQMDLFTGKLNPTGKLPITMVSCSEVIDTVPTVIDGVEYDICVSPNDVPGYDKDQYISADVLAKSPSGSYAYKDADGNIYKAWFGLSFE